MGTEKLLPGAEDYHEDGLHLRVSLISDISGHVGVLAVFLVNLQMLKQGHRGLGFTDSLSCNRVRLNE